MTKEAPKAPTKKEVESQILSDNDQLQQLWRDKNFQWFLKTKIKPSLEMIKNEALIQDVTKEAGQQTAISKILAWQKVSGIFRGIFDLFGAQAKQISDELLEDE